MTDTLPLYTRDTDEYWEHLPPDHGFDGLFVGGPEGEVCALLALLTFSALEFRITASSPDAERKQLVTYRARLLERARAWELAGADDDDEYAAKYQAALDSVTAPTPKLTNHTGYGLYGRPRKPAASGRRRKAAA